MDEEYGSWFQENMTKLMERHKELLNEKSIEVSFMPVDKKHFGKVMRKLPLKTGLYSENKNIVMTDSDGEELALQVAEKYDIGTGFLRFGNNSYTALGFFHALSKHVEVDGCDEVKCTAPLSLEGDLKYGVEAVSAAADNFTPGYEKLVKNRKKRVSAFL